jgi:mRNA-degrading endonuclease toxin of MazEF toxin-antitoxin module
VLTRQDALAALPRVLIATATTHVRDLPTEVALSRREDGVPRDCVLSLHLPEQAYRSQLVEYITHAVRRADGGGLQRARPGGELLVDQARSATRAAA